MIKSAITTLFLFNILLSQPSDIRFEHLGIEHGLSQSTVHCIIQDRKGFMWFGTSDGLNKYDGYKFTIYKNDPNDTLSLSHNFVRALYEDHLGEMWIGTRNGGLCRYDRNHETFIRYLPEKDNPKRLPSDVITVIYESKDRNQYTLWIGGAKGVNKYNRDTDDFTRYLPDENDGVESITQNLSGQIWIGNWYKGLYYFDSGKDKFIKYRPDPKYSNMFRNHLVGNYSLHTSGLRERNILWTNVDGNGFYKIDLESGYVTHFPYSIAGDILKIYPNRNNSEELWLGTDQELTRFNIQTGEFTHYLHQPANKWSLKGNVILSIFQDISGLMWLGTDTQGINKFEPWKKRFQSIQEQAANPDGLSGKTVTAILESKEGGDQAVLWIGTKTEGLNRLDRKTKRNTKYKHEPENKNSLSHNGIMAITESQSGNRQILWVSTSGGLNKIDLKTQQITRYYIPGKDPGHHGIMTHCEDKNGNIWIGTPTAYIYSFNPETEQFSRYGPYMILAQTLFFDSLGMLWVGTGDGLYKFDPATKETTYYMHIEGDMRSISNNYTYSICEDSNGFLWIGTGGGLNKFDRSMETFINYTEKDGLPSNVIKGILEDGHDNLWLSTTKGISKFNPETKTFRNYDATDGLQGDEFVTGSFYKNQQDEMFFGGTNGFTYFHPDGIKDNISIPPIAITDFLIFNKSIKPGDTSPLKKQVSEATEITLSHDQSIFSFEFAALDYHNPIKNKYRYIMEGVDPGWVHTDASRRFATYTNLDPGEYVFRVKGSNNDGLWNEEGTSLKVIILPPWWKTNWAYFSYVLLFFLTIFLARKYDLNRINLRNESNRLKEIDQLKSHFFTNISHEFRTPLTLILGPIQKLLENNPPTDEKNQYGLIQRNALRLQRLINQLLDISRLEAGKLKLNARKYDIVALTRAIVANFESHAKKRNISLTFKALLSTQEVYFNFDKFEKILTNLISNAFKFSEDDTAISITLDTITGSTGSFSEGFVRLCIQDQGIGVKEEHIDKIFQRFYQVEETTTRGYEGSGIGLALVKEMIDLHYGTITVKSEPGKGAAFIVCLPLGKSHLSIEEIEQLPTDEIKVPDEPLDDNVTRILNDNTDQMPLVLIVEDNIDVQQYIGSFLEEEYNLIISNNGKEGLESAVQEIPDLIISDVMMPVMDGIELCEELKSDERTSHIPIILLTARATLEDKIEGLDSGADDYLQKPFDINELKVRVKNLIEQRKLLKDKFAHEDGFYISKISKTPADERFVSQMMEIISDNISDPTFKLESLSKEIGMSRMQLHRKIQGLFGQSPGHFLRILRLKQAADLIKSITGNISEIAYDVGFESPAHFTSSFRRQFGITPSDYQKKHS